MDPSKEIILLDYNFRWIAKFLEIRLNKFMVISETYRSLLTLSIDSEEYHQKVDKANQRIKELYDQQVFISRLF